ncbi:MAG: ferrochelatase [Planctomycetaceae bacterium]|jgi:ferrochelatase|nr:ferrochelatase [Planctomycetaceae bacterium]
MQAFLLVSYGAPEVEGDVVPFLERLLKGKNATQDHIEKAALKYYKFAKQNNNKLSPLNNQCNKLLKGIETECNKIGLPIRIYHGNLYWRPFIEDALLAMTNDGIKTAKCFITSAFDSTASNRRYSATITAACQKIGNNTPTIEYLPLSFDQPLFIEAQAARLCEQFKRQKNNNPNCTETIIYFTAHSIPKNDPFVNNYEEQLTFCCGAVIGRCCEICPELCGVRWELVYQSQPINTTNSQWLNPSIKNKITTLVQQSKELGLNVTKNIIISPIGFFCESMETVNDLDFELNDICKDSPIKLARAQTVATTPEIYKMIAALIKDNNMLKLF